MLCIRALASVGVAALTGSLATAGEQVIYSFSSSSYYRSGVTLDQRGNLYGTDYALGGEGAIYQLHQKSPRKWKFDIVHQFDTSDGASPSAALIQDYADNRLFYGVTGYGGSDNSGTVYSLAHVKAGWTETVLHSFEFGSDGAIPSAPLWQDKATGALYGTAGTSGTGNCGAAFSLTPTGGTWKFETLYRFLGNADGCIPTTQLQPGPAAGTLIGSTYAGGSNNEGVLFELTNSGGTWSESVLHSFVGTDGANPYDLVTVKGGTLYGVAYGGGSSGLGVVFALQFKKGSWHYSVVHNFAAAEPFNPVGLLFNERSGTFYGAAQNGGAAAFGAVFSLVPNGKEFVINTLHDFYGGGDGANPAVRPTLDAQTGSIYGVTANGGVNNSGAVYVITP